MSRDVPMGIDIYRIEDRLYAWGFRAGLLLVVAVKVGPVVAWRLLRGGRRG